MLNWPESPELNTWNRDLMGCPGASRHLVYPQPQEHRPNWPRMVAPVCLRVPGVHPGPS